MNRENVAWKVGLFATMGLVLLAGLLMAFSKGLGWGTARYNLVLKTTNVGGIKHGANVLMSGVLVGKVETITLSDDGKTARMFLAIYARYQVRTNAQFNILSMGFLGDAYVSIRPQNPEGPMLKDGDEVSCEPPFDMQEVARTVVGFLNRIDVTAQKLNDAMTRLDNTLLSDQSLSNATAAVGTFRAVSDRALTAVGDIHSFFATNSAPVAQAVTNLVLFSAHLNSVADEVDAFIWTNRADIGEVVRNFQAASSTIREITTGLEAGKGMIGAMLKDETVRADFAQLIGRMNSVGTNLDEITGRVTTNGIWGILWKHKEPRPVPARTTPAQPLSPAKRND